MKVLVINSGSSSIKYQLLDTDTEAVMVSGLVERIGEEKGDLKAKAYPGADNETVTEIEQPIPDHTTGMRLAIDLLTDPEKGVLADKSEIAAIGHRVVHGGEDFHKSVVIDDTVLAAIEANVPLAPCTTRRTWTVFASPWSFSPAYRRSLSLTPLSIRPSRHMLTCMPCLTNCTKRIVSVAMASTAPPINSWQEKWRPSSKNQ